MKINSFYDFKLFDFRRSLSVYIFGTSRRSEAVVNGYEVFVGTGVPDCPFTFSGCRGTIPYRVTFIFVIHYLYGGYLPFFGRPLVAPTAKPSYHFSGRRGVAKRRHGSEWLRSFRRDRRPRLSVYIFGTSKAPSPTYYYIFSLITYHFSLSKPLRRSANYGCLASYTSSTTNVVPLKVN